MYLFTLVLCLQVVKVHLHESFEVLNRNDGDIEGLGTLFDISSKAMIDDGESLICVGFADKVMFFVMFLWNVVVEGQEVLSLSDDALANVPTIAITVEEGGSVWKIIDCIVFLALEISVDELSYGCPDVIKARESRSTGQV